MSPQSGPGANSTDTIAIKRADRVGPLIFEELAQVLLFKLEDPRLKGVTLTKVKMTADLRLARVYFSLIGDDRQIQAALVAFDRAKQILRRALGENLDLRYLPDLEFFYDPNPAYADRIDRLIHQIHDQDFGSRQQALEFIRRYSSFVVAAHVNPEGDAIGATLGLVHLLRSQGLRATPYNEDPVPGMVRFLPGADEIIHDVDQLPAAEAVIVLDAGDRDRPGPRFRNYMAGRPVLNIDHHQTNTRFGDVNWVDPTASSTGEMITALAQEMKAEISPAAALCLFTAILTDTGSFNFPNTQASTFRAAADLVEAGARPETAAEHYYHSKPLGYLLLLRAFLSSLEFNAAGTLGEAVLTQEDYIQTQTSSEVSENFINFITDVASIKVAIFYRQTDAEEWKVSLRSKGERDVAGVARRFGGGGHQNAAGCTLTGSLAEVKAQLRNAVDPLL